MKVNVILAEAATAHEDGTITALRMGISNVWSEKTPIPLQGVLVIRLETDPEDKGEHSLRIVIKKEDETELPGGPNGTFRAPEAKAHANLLMRFGIQFENEGQYQFLVMIDDREYGRWMISAHKGKKENGSEGQP